jgi:predicted GIY-YIG superfamily endonuclease
MSSLYFIQAELTRRIKIGVAKNPEQRLRLHQTGSPDRLKLQIDVRYETSRDAYMMERRLHREYETERATGEWFEETERLLREVAGLQAIKIAQSRRILEGSLANQNPETAYPRKGPDPEVKPVGAEEHLAKPELRKRIREMLASGMTQAAIARQLHKSVSTIASMCAISVSSRRNTRRRSRLSGARDGARSVAEARRWVRSRRREWLFAAFAAVHRARTIRFFGATSRSRRAMCGQQQRRWRHT